MHERAHLEALLNAIDATPRALRRDACGDWHIGGKHGHILADGKGYPDRDRDRMSCKTKASPLRVCAGCSILNTTALFHCSILIRQHPQMSKHLHRLSSKSWFAL
jgi:hypothetical protein